MKTQPTFTAIVAYDKDRGIASDGEIPWDLLLDRALFRFLTDELPVVVGRKTALQMPFPLYRRTIVVLSKDEHRDLKNIVDRQTVSEVFESLRDQTDVVVAGGEEIYQELLEYCSTILATEIDNHYDCDKFFPEINHTQWDATLILDWKMDEHHECNFRFMKYERINT